MLPKSRQLREQRIQANASHAQSKELQPPQIYIRSYGRQGPTDKKFQELFMCMKFTNAHCHAKKDQCLIIRAAVTI